MLRRCCPFDHDSRTIAITALVMRLLTQSEGGRGYEMYSLFDVMLVTGIVVWAGSRIGLLFDPMPRYMMQKSNPRRIWCKSQTPDARQVEDSNFLWVLEKEESTRGGSASWGEWVSEWVRPELRQFAKISRWFPTLQNCTSRRIVKLMLASRSAQVHVLFGI